MRMRNRKGNNKWAKRTDHIIMQQDLHSIEIRELQPGCCSIYCVHEFNATTPGPITAGFDGDLVILTAIILTLFRSAFKVHVFKIATVFSI